MKYFLTLLFLFLTGPAFAQTPVLDWMRSDDGNGNTSGVHVWFSPAGIFHIDTFQTGSARVSDINLFAGSPFSGQTPRLLLEPNYGLATLMYNLDNFIIFSPSLVGGSRWRAGGNIYLEISNGNYTGTVVGQFDHPSDPEHTGFQVWHSGELKRVTVGPPDSCGAGFRCLKIAN